MSIFMLPIFLINYLAINIITRLTILSGNSQSVNTKKKNKKKEKSREKEYVRGGNSMGNHQLTLLRGLIKTRIRSFH